jgi:hypothetical protein
MKKITLFAFAIAALSLASCKKDRTCTCTSVTTTNGVVGASTTDVTVLSKVSKGTGRANCLTTKITFSQTYGSQVDNYVIDNTCTLK